MDVRVLGSVSVALAGREVRLRPKEAHLLGLLVIGAGRSLRPDVLVEEMWGEDASTERQNALRVHLSHLRAALRGAEDGPSRVVTGESRVLARP